MKYRIIKIYAALIFVSLSLCVVSIAQHAQPTSAQEQYDRSDVEDEILVTIYSDNGKEIILQSDIRPGLDGQPRTLQDLVLERLKVLDARSLGIEFSDDETDQFLARIQHEHNMRQDELEQLFSQLGYSYAEGRQALQYQQLVERIIEHRVKSDRRLLVHREDVQAYEQEHPQYEPATYTLQQSFIPVDQHSHEEVNQHVDTGDIHEMAAWEEPFEISEEDLAPEMQFIAHKEPYTIVDVDTTSQGTEVTRLVAIKPRERVSLESRYNDIANTLRRQRYNEVLSEYHHRLLDSSTMRFTYQQDREATYDI